MKNLAKAILLSMEIRENSYDHEAADKTSENSDAFIDYSQFYTKSIMQSVAEACDDCDMETVDDSLVRTLIINSWNEAEEWARMKLRISRKATT